MTSTTSKFIAGLGIGSLLLMSAPLALAHEREGGDEDNTSANSVQANVSAQAHVEHGESEGHNGLHLGWSVGKHEGHEDMDDNNDQDGDDAIVGTTTPPVGTTTPPVGTTTPSAADIRAQVLAELRAHILSGVVSAVGSSTFNVGSNPTTTVTTNANTTYVANGVATTSGAVTTGSSVLVLGDSGVSTTSPSFTASFVAVLSVGWEKLLSFLHF